MSFDEVVHAFLGDRRCAQMRLALGDLYTSPDFQNVEHNHLRAAALVARKPAWAWLRMGLVPYDTEGLIIMSKATWTKVDLTEAMLRQGYNVFSERLWTAAEEFAAGRSCERSGTQNMFEGIEDADIARAGQAPSPTIWTPDANDPPGTFRCLEGNTRVHALVLGMVTGKRTSLDGLKAWVCKP